MGPFDKEQAGMRTLALVALGFGAVTGPLAAQSQQKISILTGDTTVTIERGRTTSCQVEVDGRALPEREAQKVCDAKSTNIRWGGDDARGLMVRLDSIRSRAMAMQGDSGLLTLQKRSAELTKELLAKSRALSEEGSRLALRSRDMTDAMRVFSFDSIFTARPIIGVTLDTRARDTDRYGAYISGVTPSGPADKAGLRAGDIIVRIDGKPTTSGATKRTVGADESRPAVRLIEIVAGLEADKEVPLEYRRGDANRTTRVTPRATEGVFAFNVEPDGNGVAWVRPPSEPPFMVYTPEGDRLPAVRPPEGIASGTFTLAPRGNGFSYSFGSVLGDTELAAMNPGLESYFGTSSGVLIVKTGEKNPLGLQAGDVVMSIDRRDIRSPSELGRVLRSYESGDRIAIGVMRDKQKQTVSARLP